MAKHKDPAERADKREDDARISRALAANLRRVIAKRMGSGGGCGVYESLAQMCALDESSIRRFEKARCGMTVANLVRLKDALGCDWADILDGCGSALVSTRRGAASAPPPPQTTQNPAPR